MMIQALVNFIRLQDALYTIVVRFFTVLGVASAGDNKRLVDDVYNYMFTSGRGYNNSLFFKFSRRIILHLHIQAARMVINKFSLHFDGRALLINFTGPKFAKL